MDTRKDYYAILGLLPNAENFVIRAAYKALSQKYHPDRCTGDAERMQAINEAYEVLSDSNSRAEYDRLRKKAYGEGPTPGDFESDNDPSPESNAEDWVIATRYYPDLVSLEKRLSKYSWRLASGYRALLLENRGFKDRISFAEGLEKGFLKQYFGPNAQLQNFASDLIIQGRRAEAMELNNTIRVIGSSEPERIIRTIISKFKLQPSRRETLEARIRSENATSQEYCEFIRLNGGRVNYYSFFGEKFQITFDNKVEHVKGHAKLRQWVLDRDWLT